MKLSFTTLACPKWSLSTILSNAQRFGFDGIDFRGTEEGLDITKQAAFRSGLADTKAEIANSGLVVSGISSSIRICDEALLSENLEEAARTIPIALELGAEQVRVFGYGDLSKGRESLLAAGTHCMNSILALDGASELKWVLEMHDNWIDSKPCIRLMDDLVSDSFSILWDIGHTTRIGSESPEETISLLGDRIRCVHIKDAIFDKDHSDAMADGWRYVLPGTGDLPLSAAVAGLQQSGYGGWYVFEHEKRWHPEIEDPSVALPTYVKWMSQFRSYPSSI